METGPFNRRISCLLIAVSFLILLTLSVYGASHTVSEDGGKYDSIQVAIDSASAGDTIVIRQGTYQGNLKIDKSLVIRGKGTVELTASPEAKGHPIVAIGPSEVSVTLSGLTLKGATKGESGTCYDNEAGLCPSGIAVRGNAELTIEKSLVTDNYTSGIYLQDGSVATAKGNERVKIGGSGVSISDSSSAVFVIDQS